MEVMVIDYFHTEKNALVDYNNSRQEKNSTWAHLCR